MQNDCSGFRVKVWLLRAPHHTTLGQLRRRLARTQGLVNIGDGALEVFGQSIAEALRKVRDFVRTSIRVCGLANNENMRLPLRDQLANRLESIRVRGGVNDGERRGNANGGVAGRDAYTSFAKIKSNNGRMRGE